MTPVFQTCVDPGKGNCHQACIAALLDLELSQVPNLILFGDHEWWNVYYYFFYALGWQLEGTKYFKEGKIPKLEDSINGHFDACVPSRTFEGKTHAVVIDVNGIVVHDPNPNQLWLGENVIETGNLKSWTIFSKLGDREETND